MTRLIVMSAFRWLPKPIAMRIARAIPGEWQEPAMMWLHWTRASKRLVAQSRTAKAAV